MKTIDSVTKTRPIQREVGFREALKKFWTTWHSKGRSSRSEMVNVYMAHSLVFAMLWCVGWLIVSGVGILSDSAPQYINALYWLNGACFLYCFILGLAGLYPAICLLIRRLKDVGRSPWWILTVFLGIPVPLLLWWVHLPSEPRENRYGPIPNLVEGE